jgi:hypothetical protein
MEIWPAETPLLRVHHSRFGATEFNPGIGSGGRFDPLYELNGAAVPTLYASDTINGAFAETVFHDVPLQGRRHVAISVLMPLVISTITVARPLRLIQLRGFGLQKLGVSRRQIIESNADCYRHTRTWSENLYRSVAEADGLLWTARQHDTSAAVLLFGTRVARRDVDVAAAARSLYPPGEAWPLIRAAAIASGITLTFG